MFSFLFFTGSLIRIRSPNTESRFGLVIEMSTSVNLSLISKKGRTTALALTSASDSKTIVQTK